MKITLRKFSMSVALPMMFVLHFGQRERLLQLLPFERDLTFVSGISHTSLLATLADMVAIEAIENSNWRRHLIHANL